MLSPIALLFPSSVILNVLCLEQSYEYLSKLPTYSYSSHSEIKHLRGQGLCLFHLGMLQQTGKVTNPQEVLDKCMVFVSLLKVFIKVTAGENIYIYQNVCHDTGSKSE